MYLKQLKDKGFAEVKRPWWSMWVSFNYLEQCFNPRNPYTIDEYVEVFGYHVDIDFCELLAEDWIGR